MLTLAPTSVKGDPSDGLRESRLDKSSNGPFHTASAHLTRPAACSSSRPQSTHPGWGWWWARAVRATRRPQLGQHLPYWYPCYCVRLEVRLTFLGRQCKLNGGISNLPMLSGVQVVVVNVVPVSRDKGMERTRDSRCRPREGRKVGIITEVGAWGDTLTRSALRRLSLEQKGARRRCKRERRA